MRHGAGEDRGAIDQSQGVGEPPAAIRARAPIDLVAQQIRHRDPEQADHDQEISKHRHEKPARFVPEERRTEKRFGREQEQNAERTSGEKFVHEEQDRGTDGMIMSNGFRKPENSPISIVARSQKLQKKARVKRTKPATRERGRFRAKAWDASGLMRPDRPKSKRKTPAINPTV